MKSELERLYVEEKLSTRQIAKKLGVSHHTVRKWMDKAGIERRMRGEAGQLQRHLVPNDALRDAYFDCDLSLSEIAQRAGWFNSRSEPDGIRVLKALGLAVNTTRKTGYYQQRFVTPKTAVVLGDALGMNDGD